MRPGRQAQEEEGSHQQGLPRDLKEIGGIVDEEVIREVVNKMTGVPLTRINADETQRLLAMEDELHKAVVSQHEAITAIAKGKRRAGGLKDPKRPIGSFHLRRPDGRGQDPARQAPPSSSCSATKLVQIDMSEYQALATQRQPVSSSGYVGWGVRKAASSPRRFAAGPIAWSSWTKSKRPTPMCGTRFCKSWKKAA